MPGRHRAVGWRAGGDRPDRCLRPPAAGVVGAPASLSEESLPATCWNIPTTPDPRSGRGAPCRRSCCLRPSCAHPRLAPGAGRAYHQVPAPRPVGAPSGSAAITRPRCLVRCRADKIDEVCHERSSGAGAGADRGAHQGTAHPGVRPRRYATGQRQGGGGARASGSRRSRAYASRARTAASTRASRSARSATAKAWSGFFRSTVRRSRASRWCGAGGCGAPSCIICAAALARRRAFRRSATSGRAPAHRSRRGPGSERPRRPNRQIPAGVAHRARPDAAGQGSGRGAMAEPKDPVRQDLGVSPGRSAGGRYVPLVRRPPPGPRGDQSAGVRGSAPERRQVRRPDATLAVPDHNVPTTDRAQGIAEEQSRIQVETCSRTAASSASRCSTSTTSARASCISSVPSRASPCPA